MTGLAGGDHLHFTMLVNGRMVSPIEWWDSHWIEDRILRSSASRRRRDDAVARGTSPRRPVGGGMTGAGPLVAGC